MSADGQSSTPEDSLEMAVCQTPQVRTAHPFHRLFPTTCFGSSGTPPNCCHSRRVARSSPSASGTRTPHVAGPPGTQFEPGSLGRLATEQGVKARREDTNDSPGTRLRGPDWEEQRRSVQRRLPEMVTALNSGQPAKKWLLDGEARLNTVSVVIELRAPKSKTPVQASCSDLQWILQ